MNEYIETVPAHTSSLWRGATVPLRHLDVELTERCNNNCIHCWINLPADDESVRPREFSTEEWKGILSEAADLGCLSVRLTGGEPLLRDDFDELYLFARRLGLSVLLCTNARLITARLADLFARIPPRLEIEVTVYGMRAESYEAVTRVAGSYSQFRRGVDLLLDHNVPFVVSGALLPPNRSEMEKFEAWSSTIPWMKSPPLYSMFFDLRKRRDGPDKNREIEQLRVSPEEALAVLSRRPERERLAWMEFCRSTMKPAGDRLFRCGAMQGGSVDAYGNYQACMSFCAPGWTYDLRGGSLREAFRVLRPRITNARAANPEYLNRCARCFLRPMCEQCPAKSWIESGSLDTPVEYLCAAAHAKAQAAGLIQDKEKAWNLRDWENRIEKMLQAVQ